MSKSNCSIFFHPVSPKKSGTKLLLFFLFFPFLIFAQSAKDKVRIDSIFRAIPLMKEDTATVNYINHIHSEYLWQFDLPEAYNKLKYAVKLSKKLGYDKGEFTAYANMSGYCIRAGVSDYALSNRMNALAVAERMHDSLKIVGQSTGIGLVYHSLRKDSLALTYYFKAKRLTEASGESDRISRLYAFMAWSYQELHQDSVALVYASQALDMRKKQNYIDGIKASLGSVRSINLSSKKYAQALAANQEMMDIAIRLDDRAEQAACYMFRGIVAERLDKLDTALSWYNKAQVLVRTTDDKNVQKDLCQDFASVYARLGDSAVAYRYFSRFVAIRDSIQAKQAEVSALRVREIYDVESKNQELELKEKDIVTKQKTLIGLALILLITAVLGVIIYSGYRRKKRSAHDLGLQKKIIEEKNKDITDSIQYAKRIQQAILPSLPQIKAALPESFILYRPKDIVSGDFFWFAETNDSYYIAAADCTGHGVPGALMSMIGFNFLGQIINEMKLSSPSEILNELHRKILMALNKDYASRDIKDGMDIALLRIRKDRSGIVFSGAVRPLCLVRAGVLETYKGDIYSIGGIMDVNTQSFTEHHFAYEKGLNIYLFSDGFADQFGGPQKKKFKNNRLRETLMTLSSRPMDEQQQELDTIFENWKGELEQVDDVLLIGIRLV